MKTIDAKRPPGGVSVLAQDRINGPLRLTRHGSEAHARLRMRSTPGIAVYETDDGQIVRAAPGGTLADAHRAIDAV